MLKMRGGSCDSSGGHTDCSCCTSTVDKSTPLMELFDRSASISTGTPATTSVTAHPEAPSIQHFYMHRWEVIGNASDYDTHAEEDISAKAGSAIGSALRTDETAESQSKSLDATWQGSMSKPTQKWPPYTYEFIYIYVYIYICCVHIHIHMCTYIYIWMYINIHVYNYKCR